MMSRDERLLFGHLWAVAGASALLLIYWPGKSIVESWMLGDLSLGKSLWALLQSLWALLLGLPILFPFLLLAVAFTWITAAIPIVVVFLIAERFRIRNIWYYVICGALTGMLATPLFTARGGTLPILAFYQQWITDAPLVVSCGAFGGLLYWWKAGRWAGAEPTSSASAIQKNSMS